MLFTVVHLWHILLQTILYTVPFILEDPVRVVFSVVVKIGQHFNIYVLYNVAYSVQYNEQEKIK